MFAVCFPGRSHDTPPARSFARHSCGHDLVFYRQLDVKRVNVQDGERGLDGKVDLSSEGRRGFWVTSRSERACVRVRDVRYLLNRSTLRFSAV